MEARTGLVVGGVTAVAASIAVVTAVALTNTMALADSPGTSLAAKSVVVPSAASPSASPRPTPTAVLEALPQSDAEVVEAPAPLVVDPPSGTQDPPVPAAPVTPPAPDTQPGASTPAVPTDVESVIAEAKASGSWEALRAWAVANGWSSVRTDALVSRLEREPADTSGDTGDLAESPVRDHSERRQGLVRSEAGWPDRTASADGTAPPDRKSSTGSASVGRERPAHAGSNVGNGNGAGLDAKKNQSRHSPEKRD